MPRPRWRVRWRARRANGRTRRSCRSISAAPHRPVRNCARSWRRSATAPRSFALDQLKIGQAGSVMLEGAGSFDRVNTIGKTDAEFQRRVARPDHRADRAAGAGAGGAAQCDGRKSRPGAPQAVARSRQERATGRSRQRARRVRSRYAPAQGRRHDRGKARHRGPARHRSRGARAQRVQRSNRDCRRAGPSIAGGAGARSRDRGGRWPGAIRRLGDGHVARAVAAESEDVGNRPRRRSGGHGRAMGDRAEGQRQFEGSQRRSRAAAGSQAIGCAGAKYQPVVARRAFGQPAELRRSGQRDIGLAAARPRGADRLATKRTSRARSASTRSISRRRLRWPSALRGTTPPSRSVPDSRKAGAAASRFRRCAARFRAAANCARSAASSRATASR